MIPKLVVALVVMGPSLFAQEPAFFAAVQFDQTAFKTQAINSRFTAGSTTISWVDRYQAARKLGFGICVGHTPAQSDQLALDIETAYRFYNESAIRDQGRWLTPTPGSFGYDLGRYGLEYLSIGGSLRFKKLYGLGLGLELRQEKQSVRPYQAGGTNPPEATQTVTSNRPWLTASLHQTFQSSRLLQPFISFRAAYALTRHDAPQGSDGTTVVTSQQMSAWTKDFARSLAPTYQLMLQSGIRF